MVKYADGLPGQPGLCAFRRCGDAEPRSVGSERVRGLDLLLTLLPQKDMLAVSVARGDGFMQ